MHAGMHDMETSRVKKLHAEHAAQGLVGHSTGLDGECTAVVDRVRRGVACGSSAGAALKSCACTA